MNRVVAFALTSFVALACSARSTGHAPPAPSRHGDCRSGGCRLGETCVTEPGCSEAWSCKGCAMAYLSDAREYCGCDGKTFRTYELGCQTIPYAHVGACSR